MRIWVLALSLTSKPPVPEITPAKVVLPDAAPTVRVRAFRFTAELDAPAREAIAWSMPSARVELPLPLASRDTAVRPFDVGSALAALALSVAPLMR